MNLFRFQVAGDIAILGGDDPVGAATPLNAGVEDVLLAGRRV